MERLTSSENNPLRTTNVFSGLPSPPDIRQPRTWSDEVAPPTWLGAFAASVVKQYHPGLASEQIASVVNHLAGSAYTIDELRWAFHAMAADTWLAEQIAAKTPNPFFILPAIARIIKRSRQIRRQLTEGLLSEWDVGKLLGDVPELSWSDFQRGGYDPEERPLYRYAPGTTPSQEAAAMQKLFGRGNE